MLHRPEFSEQGAEFELATLEREMRREPALAQNGHTARTLIRLPDLRVVLIVMQSGSRIAEHAAFETATVHVLAGQLRLGLPDGAIELPAGRLLMLPSGLRHDVEATGESAFLLTLGSPREQPHPELRIPGFEASKPSA